MNRSTFTVHLPEKETIRVDKFIASQGMFNRSQISCRSLRAYDSDGRELKLSRRLCNGETIDVQWDNPPSSELMPEAIPLDVLYEDDSCLVINKPQGMVVHPAPGHNTGTLVQALLFRYKDFEHGFDTDCIRPGIVHRLDKDTSGILIAAKSDNARDFLARQFKARTVDKTYLAITRGIPSARKGQMDSPIGRNPGNRKQFKTNGSNAKSALTRYRILAQSTDHALVLVHLLSGRTHQIRVHFQSLNTPVLGDSLYGRKDTIIPDAPLMLHSWRLGIDIGDKGNRRVFEAPIPDRFYMAAETLGLTMPV